MAMVSMCSWCHEMSGEQFCPKCGHEVGVARMDCRCPSCRWQFYSARLPIDHGGQGRNGSGKDLGNCREDQA